MAAYHLTLADAILLVALAVVAPAYSYYAGIRIGRGFLPERIRAYARTMLSWWLIALTMLFLWWRLGRPFMALGLHVPGDPRSIAGAVLCVLMLAYMNGQWRVVARMSPEKLARVPAALGRAVAILPRTPSEYRWFLALSVTAGICEELLFRGYFLAVTSQYLTLTGAVVAGAAIFGLGHAYQGARGIVKTGVAGVLFGAIYIATGSLVWPMILHALLDVQGGAIAFRALRSAAPSRTG
ncbi:MAG: type II CAAX endopeptidase family protein [Candidatus Tumulicola sp.]